MCPGPKRNQLETPGGAKSFLRGAQIFLTVSNSFKLYAAHFSREGENLSRGGFSPLRPSGYGPGCAACISKK